MSGGLKIMQIGIYLTTLYSESGWGHAVLE